MIAHAIKSFTSDTLGTQGVETTSLILSTLLYLFVQFP